MTMCGCDWPWAEFTVSPGRVCPGLLEVTRVEEKSSRKAVPADTLIPAASLQTCGRTHFCFKPLSLWCFVRQPCESDTLSKSHSFKALTHCSSCFGSCRILAFCLPAFLTCLGSLEAVSCSVNSLSTFRADVGWVLAVPLYRLCGLGQDISSL